MTKAFWNHETGFRGTTVSVMMVLASTKFFVHRKKQNKLLLICVRTHHPVMFGPVELLQINMVTADFQP